MSPPSTLTLSIETSNPSAVPVGGAVAIIRGEPGSGSGAVLGVEPVGAPSRHEDSLTPTIDRLCRRLEVRARDLERVVVSVGPGGYTSLRIAVTTAKAIAEATGAALIGVPTALGLLRGVAPQVRGAEPVAVCLAWKREDVWVQTFAPGCVEPESRGRTISLERFDTLGAHHLVFERRLRETLLERGLLGEARSWSEPVFDPVSVHEASLGLGAVDPAQLVPLYPREPEAVTKWRARGASGR